MQETAKKPKKERAKKEIPEEQKLLNEMMRMARRNCYHFIKSIENSDEKESYVDRMVGAFKQFNNVIAEIQNELEFKSMFATMSNSEKEMLKKMLSL